VKVILHLVPKGEKGVELCVHSPVPLSCCGTKLSSVRLYPYILTVTNLVKYLSVFFLATQSLRIELETVFKTSYILNFPQTMDSFLHHIGIVNVALSQFVI
jgi:hypothetical protein